jgi:hypothetical protein
MRARAALLAVLVFCAGCSSTPPEPLRLERGLVTVHNQTDEEWRGVELWVNNYYRALVPAIAARGIFQVHLDSFISGYGQRFDNQRAQINDLRLTASRPNGERIELKKRFQDSMLKDAAGGTR